MKKDLLDVSWLIPFVKVIIIIFIMIVVNIILHIVLHTSGSEN